MEMALEIDGSDIGKFVDDCFDKNFSDLSPLKHIADPVVYKLVRVEGDGRLVPATDDELMEVEGFLEDDKCQTHIVADSGQMLECISINVSSSGMSEFENPKGLLYESLEENTENLNALLECKSAFISLSREPRFGDIEEAAPSTEKSFSENQVTKCGSGGCLESPDGLREEGSSTPTDRSHLKPDFSVLEGEICMDNLSIRELHDIFRAAFGRETTVKDKQWLKRRIAMGLTNSCDIRATSFTIKDNKLVGNDVGEEQNIMNGSSIDPGRCFGDSKATNSQNSLMGHQAVSGVELRSSGVENSGDLQTEERAAKRVRKPTKRYIEELSEAETKECCGKLTIFSRTSVIRPSVSQSCPGLARRVSLQRRNIFTRLDSLGGSGVRIPCVYRVRRSRPRKNVMALMDVQPSIMGTAAEVGKHGLDVSTNRILKASSDSDQIQCQLVGEAKDDIECATVGKLDLWQNPEPKHMKPSANSSSNYPPGAPTARGGIRRKHHRAWTLSEVTKLVDGVSRYGAGRWSQIKRIAFASYSYRTSVDLKDKWRNLLKASFAEPSADKGVNFRKHPSMPIPASVLSRVRELAQRHAQVPMKFIPSQRQSVGSGLNVDESQNQDIRDTVYSSIC